MHILYVYLFQKAKRTHALEELQKMGWQTEQRRIRIRKILNVNLTSSDEECNDGFITHPPSLHGANLCQGEIKA